MKKINTLWKVLAATLMVLGISTNTSAQTFTVGTPQVLFPSGARPAGMLDWPDSPLGVKKISGTYYIFADSGFVPSSGHSGIQGITTPDLNSIPATYTIYTPTTNLALGSSTQFDRDYVGGGATIYDAADNIIIMLYHGEYHWVEGQPHFTGGLGLVVSHDLGLTWTKLGVVLLPNYNWSTCIGTSDPAGLDIGDGDLNMRPDGYTYFYYNEKAGDCNSSTVYNGVARANTAALIAAAVAGGQPSGSLFQKYSGGSFSTPGVIDPTNQALGGGASDNISPSFLMYDPVVRFDSYINKYIMTYIVPWTGLAMAFSTDGLTWTNPTPIFTDGTDPSGVNAYVYGTPINTDGGDPDVLGSSFWVYYENPYGNWAATNLDRVLITITSGGTSTVATPSISPSSGAFSSPQTITISDSTGGSTICYTTDGSTPTANGAGTCTHGTTYSSGFSQSIPIVINAIASESGFSDSSMTTNTYTLSGGSPLANVYISQSGSGSGTSCSSPEPVSFFNNASNWGNSTGQIGSNTIVHLCGTFTGSAGSTMLTPQGSGTAGQPVTILFESGAVLTAPYWNSSNGAILCSSQNFINIDGGLNGIIQNTDDGNDGQGNDQQSGAIELSQCSNIIVKNLTIKNIYIQQHNHSYGGNCSTRVDSFAISADGGSHIRLTNLNISNVRIGTGMGAGTTGGTDFEIDHNLYTNVEVTAAAASAALPHTNFRIHDNHFAGGAWIFDGPDNCYHHEAFHGFGSGSPYPDQIYIYNNLIDGIWGTNDSGQHVTAGFFTEFVGPTVIYVNNVIDFSTGGVGNEPDNGFIFCKGDGSIDGNNHCEAYNNTFISQGTFGTSFEAQLGSSQMQFQNNIVVGADGPGAGGDLWAVKPNNNQYFTTLAWHIPAGATNWAGWQGYGADINGHDGNGSGDDPGTYASDSYIPTSGSLAINLAANLSSKCSTLPWICFDKNGNPRSPSGTWTAGAVIGPSSGAPGPTVPTVPTGKIPALVIAPTVFPAATVGVPFSQLITTTGGTPPIKFVVTGLPVGLNIGTATSTSIPITGSPTASGPFSPKVTATDSEVPTVSVAQTYALTVAPAVVVPVTTYVFNPSVTSLSFSTPMGTNPACQTFTLADSTPSGQHVPFSIKSNVTWLPITTNTPATGSTAQVINICPNVTGVNSGSFSGVVTATATGKTAGGFTVSSPVSIAVNLVVSAVPQIESYSFNPQQGTISLGQGVTITFNLLGPVVKKCTAILSVSKTGTTTLTNLVCK